MIIAPSQPGNILRGNGGAAISAITSISAQIEQFHRAIRSTSRRHLLNNVDRYLDQMDQAKARGDQESLALATAKWNAVWDELDTRDGTPVEVAS